MSWTPPGPKLYKVEVLADDSGKYCSNGLVFGPKDGATALENATAYGQDLASRWTLVQDWRVREATAEEIESGSLR